MFSLAIEPFSRPSDVPLDVVIPVLRKDWAVLPFVLRGIACNLRHPVRHVYLVGPERPEPWNSEDGRVAFVHEGDAAPLQREEITLRPAGKDRSGWMLQQLIKLSCDEFCRSEHVLVLDADTILLRPQRFVKDGRDVINVSDEHYEPYYTVIRRLLPGLAIFPMSFVCHLMILQANVLRALRAELARDGVPWFQTILNAIDPTEFSCFSEYELYGNFVLNRFPDKVRLEHFLNVSYASDRTKRLPYVRLRHPFSKSASFHSR